MNIAPRTQKAAVLLHSLFGSSKFRLLQLKFSVFTERESHLRPNYSLCAELVQHRGSERPHTVIEGM